jgi:hypothetical protein
MMGYYLHYYFDYFPTLLRESIIHHLEEKWSQSRGAIATFLKAA